MKYNSIELIEYIPNCYYYLGWADATFSPVPYNSCPKHVNSKISIFTRTRHLMDQSSCHYARTEPYATGFSYNIQSLNYLIMNILYHTKNNWRYRHIYTYPYIHYPHGHTLTITRPYIPHGLYTVLNGAIVNFYLNFFIHRWLIIFLYEYNKWV